MDLPRSTPLAPVVNELVESGHFGAVDVLDCVTRTPTLAELAAYDAVLPWSEVAYFDAAALGLCLPPPVL